MKFIKKTDRIFIAGHNGMVGKSIKRTLENKGFKNLLTVSKDSLNLMHSENVSNWFQINRPEVVIIAAARVGGIEANYKFPYDFILDNLKIQTNIIENAWENNAKKLLFLGSSCIYPKFSEQPIKEESLLTGPLEKTNEFYAIAKIAGLKLCSALRKQHNFDAITLMPTNLYGPGDNYNQNNSHVLPAFINRFYNAKIKGEKYVTCWGSGNPKREFLHVDDLASASIFILENFSFIKNTFNQDNLPEFLNVGTGKDISIKDLAYLVANKIGYKGEIFWDPSKPDGTPRKLLDISRISDLGWKPLISLEDGIEETIKSYKKDLKMKKLRN